MNLPKYVCFASFLLCTDFAQVSTRKNDRIELFAKKFLSALKSEDIKAISSATGVKQFNLWQEDFFTGKLKIGEFGSKELTFNEFIKKKPSYFIRKWYRWFDWQKEPLNKDTSYAIWFIRKEKLSVFKKYGENADLEFMVDFMVCNVIFEKNTFKLDDSLCFSDAGAPGGFLD
jgi:hypothetical protein